MSVHDLSADQPRKQGKFDFRTNSDPDSQLTAVDDYARYDDQAAVAEILETVKHLTSNDAERIAQSVSETSWGARYRLSQLSGPDEFNTLTDQARAAISHLDGQLTEGEHRSAEVAVVDALVAAQNFRRLGSEDGWGLAQYDELTEPWRKVVGSAHPSEVEPPAIATEKAIGEVESPEYEHYDSMVARMDIADFELAAASMGFVREDRPVFFDPTAAPPPF